MGPRPTQLVFIKREVGHRDGQSKCPEEMKAQARVGLAQIQGQTRPLLKTPATRGRSVELALLHSLQEALARTETVS